MCADLSKKLNQKKNVLSVGMCVIVQILNLGGLKHDNQREKSTTRQMYVFRSLA